MANAKISDDLVFIPETTDVRDIGGLAGFTGSNNAKITGQFLAQSVVNESGSGIGVNDGSGNINSRVAFYGVGNPSDTLAGAEGFQYYSANSGNSTPASLQLGVAGGNQYDAGNLILLGNYIGGSTSPKVEFRANDTADPNDFKSFIITPSDSATDDQTWILPEALPTAGQVLEANAIATNDVTLSWVTPAGGGASAFTTLTAADVIDWDYATDGPNIKVTLGAGLENVLTVNTIGEFPDGSEGWVILDPSASVDYRLPDEDEGSAATMRSVITNGDVSLGGTNPVLFHYTYDGSTFYWTKFENMIAPANYPPSIDYDGSDLLVYVTPEAFNQATQGQIAGSAVFNNLVQPSTFGDMRGPISPGSGFEFYPRDAVANTPAYWSMGTGTVGIFRDTDLSLVNALSNNISWQGYIQGPYSGTFETLVDFDGATNTGSYNQHLYISSGRFRVYNPSTFYNFPELDDYSVDGGANLEDAWLFVSFGITAGATGTATLRVACQASLDAAVAAGGPTAWNYNGTGASSGLGPLTVNVDANGIYEEVVTDNFDEADIVNILIGVNNLGGEYGNFHYGLYGVYNKDINLADTTQNWIDTREIYGIT